MRMTRGRGGAIALASTAMLALAACQGGLPTLGAGLGPLSSPRPQSAPQDLATTAPRSAESVAMEAYFMQVEQSLVGQGLLRRDVAPRDAPYTARQLTEDFIHIALYDEYSNRGGAFVATASPSHLRRWAEPVKIDVQFSASIPSQRQAQDRATISAYAGQLARASHFPVTAVNRGGNFTVLVMNEDERRAAGPLLQELVPGIDSTSVRAITDLPPTTFCVVFAFSEGAAPTYSRAVAVIRGEHPDALRLSCLHEELAQGLGLANDYPRARPSIFNDDEEFALLTRHDELLLQILYDPRLRPGMNEAQARPIVSQIAKELMGEAPAKIAAGTL
ncbi:hypothetical protein BFP70_00670 [Thioclava sp. SK-1]|uniref:DUF2927 domain-containing protein n=1 Tax=Thioclava sp. SK-1 TaxID=1889770 RepID=UPI0008240BEC|nr:DUF2927 domain-containing protein [Thioclava sp. SK-1]OCX66706.1 hypothetical protein BFP70_00670 [Thioclava sp. SK-1]